jgi:hypothetical protein
MSTDKPTLRVVFCDIMSSPVVKDFEIGSGSLAALQEAVGGLVDCIAWQPGVDVWVNDEGRINGMPANRHVPDYGDIHGPFVVAGSNDEGETVSLTEEQCDQALKAIMYWPMLIPVPPPGEDR